MLLGKQVRVILADNPHLKGIAGRVINETKNTLTLLTPEKKEKKLIKSQVTLQLNQAEIKPKNTRPEEITQKR